MILQQWRSLDHDMTWLPDCAPAEAATNLRWLFFWVISLVWAICFVWQLYSRLFITHSTGPYDNRGTRCRRHLRVFLWDLFIVSILFITSDMGVVYTCDQLMALPSRTAPVTSGQRGTLVSQLCLRRRGYHRGCHAGAHCQRSLQAMRSVTSYYASTRGEIQAITGRRRCL